jgi:hypothetical protein
MAKKSCATSEFQPFVPLGTASLASPAGVGA